MILTNTSLKVSLTNNFASLNSKLSKYIITVSISRLANPLLVTELTIPLETTFPIFCIKDLINKKANTHPEIDVAKAKPLCSRGPIRTKFKIIFNILATTAYFTGVLVS